MEKSTPSGLILGLVFVFGTVFMGDGWQTFFQPASIMLVLGGTFSALLIAFSLDEIKQIPPRVVSFFKFEPPDLTGYIEEFSELSRVARREGLLALDRRLSQMDHELMQFGLEMAVDGVDEKEVNELLRGRITEEVQQDQLASKFFNTAGTYAPAFGMVGTLIGLIQMLQNLDDPSAIGPAMAVAMLTTFYGALLANLVFLPFANKMKAQTRLKVKASEMIRTGIISIVRGDSPTMIEKRLSAFVQPDQQNGDEEAAEPTPLSKAA